ncbi:hypothetical protein QBC33DRAFT_558208 [Phialemonium atrogriseum]|uniref:Uncharacterized protein n=1 Tax=Phialemonium atrogriseum TaxID=1093897 RepID=A0AAJ0FPD4_9PEZI|nr:uncharacterized protein QBC33DRAFT_558208 [Phialemonium atrogriseum]KAK1768045.1 hypothetical protein QBC33DRAFT_558208 [Phialemonium atrogriseum]
MSRLLTTVIFINESQPGYNRRNYEPPQVQKNLGLKTLGQPIERLSRNLRTVQGLVQGLDYIHALRGLDFLPPATKYVQPYHQLQAAQTALPSPSHLPSIFTMHPHQASASASAPPSFTLIGLERHIFGHHGNLDDFHSKHATTKRAQLRPDDL